MDIFTHAALGAVIGEAWGRKKLGKKAMVIGAVANCLPDVDTVMSLWLRPVDNLLAHRGITHSFFFCGVLAVLLGLSISRWRPFTGISTSRWIQFIGLQLMIHILVDVLNNYGTGWLEPFRYDRFALDVLYVVDPFFSGMLILGSLVLAWLRIDSSLRRKWVIATLLVSSLYLMFALFNKAMIDRSVKNFLQGRNMSYSRVLTTPTPMNVVLWFIAVETDSGYQIGYRSIFDKSDSIEFRFFPRQTEQLGALADTEDVRNLIRFSDGFYTVEQRNGTLFFNDLRFGQMAGWSDPAAGFAFHYDLLHPEANRYVVQQGRVSQWNRKTFSDLLRRL